MDACMEKNTILRHPACYGLGVCAQFAPELTKPHAGALLAAMIRVVTAREARSDTNEACTDNAVSACLKLARFCASALPPAQVEGIMDHVLSYLPLKGDLIEARLVHGWLVEAFAANDPLWLGAGGARAPRMVEALGKVLLAFEKTSEEEEEDTVEEAHLAILKQTTSAMAAAAGQGAATLRAIVANLQNPNLRAPLGRYGFPV
jgi:ferredoxin